MKNQTKKKVVSVILFTAFLVIVPIGVYCSSAPSITVPTLHQHTVNYWVGKEPPVNITIRCLFTAEGSLSVNTPVSIHAIITDANVSNLLQYYGWIAFTNAYNTSTVGNPKQTPNTGFLPITSTSQNQYEADGTVVWLKDGPTWVYLVPATGGEIIVKAPDIERGDGVVSIAPVSDRLSTETSIRQEQLSWVMLGVGILAFQPVISAFIPEDKHRS